MEFYIDFKPAILFRGRLQKHTSRIPHGPLSLVQCVAGDTCHVKPHQLQGLYGTKEIINYYFSVHLFNYYFDSVLFWYSTRVWMFSRALKSSHFRVERILFNLSLQLIFNFAVDAFFKSSSSPHCLSWFGVHRICPHTCGWDQPAYIHSPGCLCCSSCF